MFRDPNNGSSCQGSRKKEWVWDRNMKKLVVGRFFNAWKCIKFDVFWVAMGVYELIFGQKEGKYIQEAF